MGGQSQFLDITELTIALIGKQQDDIRHHK